VELLTLDRPYPPITSKSTTVQTYASRLAREVPRNAAKMQHSEATTQTNPYALYIYSI
jgi:hypothetical protein